MVGQTLMDPAFPVAPFGPRARPETQAPQGAGKTVPRFESVGARVGCEWPVRECPSPAGS
jgi:hypothetical protein